MPRGYVDALLQMRQMLLHFALDSEKHDITQEPYDKKYNYVSGPDAT